MKKNNVKAQMWFTDFVIAALIFSFILISYYTYTISISKRDTILFDEIVSDAKTVSSFLTSKGYPEDWNADNVIRIGFTDEYNRVDNEKFNEFIKMDHNKTKKLLGTTHDYVLFFLNGSGDVQNVEGYCGYGNCQSSIAYKKKAAYYHKDEIKLKQFMIDNFYADIYEYKTDQDIDDLIANINDYGLVVLESPELDTSEYNNLKNVVESFVSSGGVFMQSGRPIAANKREMLGVKFFKITGDAGKDKPATVIRGDEFITFEYSDQIVFNQVYYIEDVSIGSSLVDIARFNESDVEIADIMDNKIAVARWPYGKGKALFFSDFDAALLSGDFIENLKDSTLKWIGSECLPIDTSNADLENLVRIERLVIYNSKIVRMVLYTCNS